MHVDIFHQMFDPQSSTYTYVLADSTTLNAAIIDPVLETASRDLDLLQELGLNLKFIFETHTHSDHITGASWLREKTGAQIAVSKRTTSVGADILLEDSQQVSLGDLHVEAIMTPGHSIGGMSYLCGKRVFTGDTLHVRGIGRTDLGSGSAEDIFHSIRGKLFKLPDDTKVFPGHDYRGYTRSCIGAEKKHNPVVKESYSREEVLGIIADFRKVPPHLMSTAVDANNQLGKMGGDRIFYPQVVDGVPEITSGELTPYLGKVLLLDVRREDEFYGTFGHIPGAKLVTLGPDLDRYLEEMEVNEEVVFVCKSGGRSGNAATQAISKGFTRAVSLRGGMINWASRDLPRQRK